MSYGLQVENLAGSILIDSTFDNYCFRDYFSTTSFSITGFGNYQGFIDIPYKPDFIAFSCNKLATNHIYGTNPTTGVTRYWFNIPHPISGAKVELYTFSRVSEATVTGAYGLQTFDSGGDVIYDSRRPYLNVLNFVTGVHNQNYSAENLAAVQCSALFTVFETFTNPGPDPDFMTFVTRSGVKTVGNNFTVDIYDGANGPYDNPTNEDSMESLQMGYMVVDVSKFYQGNFSD